MSFLSNPKTAGIAFLILGCFQIIGGISSIALPFSNKDVSQAYYTIVGVGAIICGLLMYFYGYRVYKGIISKKIDILAAFVRIIGVVAIIGGLFSVAAKLAVGADLGSQAAAAIIAIIIGLIIIFISTKINDGKNTTGDSIIWVILLIVFILELIVAIFTIVGGLNPLSLVVIITGICNVLIYIFMLVLLCDKEVKAEMI
jgi:hypothetical protein